MINATKIIFLFHRNCLGAINYVNSNVSTMFASLNTYLRQIERQSTVIQSRQQWFFVRFLPSLSLSKIALGFSFGFCDVFFSSSVPYFCVCFFFCNFIFPARKMSCNHRIDGVRALMASNVHVCRYKFHRSNENERFDQRLLVLLTTMKSIDRSASFHK